MAYIKVTATGGQNALIRIASVSKVIDFGSYRAIYQGADTNNYQVRDTLANIEKGLKAG